MNNLHNYQVEIVREVVDKGSCALFLEMGLGKTAIMLNVMNMLITKNQSLRFLVISPKELTLLTWPAELKKFTPNLVYHNEFNKNKIGRPRFQPYDYELKHDVCFLSYTLVRSFFLNKLHLNYNALIIDESTKFKGYRNKTFAILRDCLKGFKYRFIMTGTPIPNGYLDYYNQIYLIDEGERLGKNFFKFRERFFTKLPYFSYKYKLNEGADKTIQELTKDIVISKSSASLPFKLPDFIPSIIFRNMDEQTAKEYKSFKKDFVLTLKNDEPTIADDSIVAKSQADLVNKMLQFCSGAIYLTPDQVEAHKTREVAKYRLIHIIKLNLLEEILDAHKDRIILAYNYQHEADRILERFPTEVIQYDGKPATIEAWEQGKTNRVLMSHPSSIGYGLNLQNASNVIVWFGFTWNLELYQQFNKRLHRQGQTKPVYCIHLAVGDIEYKLMDRLKTKDITQQALLKYMQTCGLEPTIDGFIC